MLGLPPPPPPQAAIVITGTALPEPRSEQVYGVDRLTRQDIERSPSHTLDQLLKDIPGVQLFRRSDSHSSHPTSQGVTLRALGGNASSRALLTLDGIPQGDPFGGWVIWPSYDPGALSQIRLVPGGGSVANGPGALAGTIQLTSRTDRGVSGEVDGGSRNALEASGRIGMAAGGGTLSVSGRVDRGNGFIPITQETRGPADRPAPYRAWNGRLRWVAPVGGSIELQASLAAFHDGRNRGTDFSDNRTDGADAALRLVGRGRWQWSALGYWQWRDLMSSFASVSPGRLTATRVSLQYKVPSHGLGTSVELRPPMPSGIELRFGADARRTDGESREFYSFVAAEPTRRRVAGGETVTAGAYAESSAVFGRFTVTGGGRMDRWQVTDGHLHETIIATDLVTRDELYVPREGWLPTARGGVAFDPGGGVKLRTAAYLGWRMPTLNELFRPFRAGADATAANPALDPERLSGAEAGADFARGPWRLSLTAFANRLSDAIANVTSGQGPGTFPGVGFVPAGGVYRQRENVDAVAVRGIEASVAWSRGPWTARAGASFSHARMAATGPAAFLDGLRPAQTPAAAATLAAGWDLAGKSALVELRFVGGQYDDDLNTRRLAPATTIDGSASWPIGHGLQLVARAENITDALVVAGIGGDGSIERATPRTLWIGLRLR
ncbi:MAG: TonB-dependent receptor [Sphingomicrobium sp.]